MPEGGDEFGPLDEMLEPLQPRQVVPHQILVQRGEPGLEVGEFDHDSRDDIPAEPPDGFEPVPPGDQLVRSRHHQRLEQSEAADAVDEIGDLGFRDGAAQVADFDVRDG